MKVKFAHALFYLLILLLPVQLGKHFWPSWSYISGLRIDYLSPTVYVTDIIVLVMMVYAAIDTIKNGSTKTIAGAKPFLVIILFFCINSAFAQNPLLAFFKSLKIAELAFVIFYIKQYKPSFPITSYCLLITILYSSLLAWLQFYHQSSMNGLLWFLGERTFNVATPGIARIGIFGKELLRPYATFPHPNVLAGYLVTTLPLIMNLNFKRHFKLPIILFLLATIVITFSRTAVFTLILFGAIVLFTKTSKKIASIILGMLAIALFWIIPIINKDVVFSAESLTIRNELNTAALAMWRDHPIVGVGLNNFLPTLPSYLRIDNFQSLQPVHNGYLLILAEMGIVGAILFLLLIYYIYQMLNAKWQMANNSKNKTFITYHLSFIISSCSIVFLSLFDHYFLTLQQTQLLLALILGYIFSFHQTANKRYNKDWKEA